jgi:hypothetical protein
MHAIILIPALLPPLSSLTRTLFLRPPRPGRCVLAWVSVCSSRLPMPTTCSARPNDLGAQSGTMHLRCSTAWPSRTPCGRALSARLCTCATVPTVAPWALPPASHSPSLRCQRPTPPNFASSDAPSSPDKLRRKLSEIFQGVMVGYPLNAPSYRIYNPEARRITTSVHVVF